MNLPWWKYRVKMEVRRCLAIAATRIGWREVASFRASHAFLNASDYPFLVSASIPSFSQSRMLACRSVQY